MRRLFYTLIFLLQIPVAFSQHQVSGYVRDAESGENLIGAAIVNRVTNNGTVTNNYGYFTLKSKGDSINIVCSYVGYDRKEFNFVVKKDTTLTISLVSSNELDEVVINAERAEKIQQSSSMSTLSIPIQQIKSLPSLFGERDIIKILQLLPGVQGGNEGSSGLYVRGGGPDQNLILLDGVPIYNASHLYGFFSTFNADAINRVDLIKGGFPARYGGRTSSVLDISMKEGNQEKFSGQGTIGIISSKFLLEGPMGEKTSYLFSARRSYMNLLNSTFLSAPTQDIANDYYLYDLNLKVNSRINKKNRIYLSAYVGGDHAKSDHDEFYETPDLTYASATKSTLGWGNKLAALRWNHVFKDRLFSNVSATYSRYNYNTTSDIARSYTVSGINNEQFYNYDYSSGIEDYTLKVDFDFIPNTKHYIKFGAGVINHLFTPGILAVESDQEISSLEYSSSKVTANEMSAYVEDDWQLTDKLKVNFGLHGASFIVQDKSYSSIQPRVSARFLVTEQASIKASYAVMNQFVHLLANAGIGLPTDLWVPSTSRIKPQTSSQWALGFAQNFRDEFEISVEGYYKKLNNIIEYKDGASYLSVDQDWQDKVEMGRGESYGAEFFVQKKVGKINGWVGYTLSWTNRQFDNINRGEWFPYRYDRRHDIKIALAYAHNKHWDFGATWTYGTGNAITIPLVAYQIAGTDGFSEPNSGPSNISGFDVAYIDKRNGYRMAAYHRMDINVSYKITGKKFTHEFMASGYNAYGRKNPFYLGFASTKDGIVLRQFNLFAFVPSLSYSIKF